MGDRTFTYDQKQLFLCKIFLVRHISTPWSFYRTLRKITCVGNCVGKAYAGCVGGLFPYASPEHGYNLLIAAKRVEIKKSSIIMQIVTEKLFLIPHPFLCVTPCANPYASPAQPPTRRKSLREPYAKPYAPPAQNRGGFFSPYMHS